MSFNPNNIKAQEDGIMIIFPSEAQKGRALTRGLTGSNTENGPGLQSFLGTFHGLSHMMQHLLHLPPRNSSTNSQKRVEWRVLLQAKCPDPPTGSGQHINLPCSNAPGQRHRQGPTDTWPRPSQKNNAGKSPCLCTTHTPPPQPRVLPLWPSQGQVCGL